MKLTVYNGSPRGEKSSSTALLEHFLAGFLETAGNSYEVFHLNRVNRQDEFVKAFGEAEAIILIAPVYTDSMPAVVKTFIESLSAYTEKEENPPLGFILHSGFPEAVHSRYAERYFEKLARRLNSPCTGTIVRGGSEGIREMPNFLTKKVFGTFHELGRIYGETGKFDPPLVHSLAKRDRFSFPMRLLVRVMKPLGLTNAGWNTKLKANKMLSHSRDRPYAD